MNMENVISPLWPNEKSSLPNISFPQEISNMGVEEPAFCMIFEVATELPNFESLRFHEDSIEEPPFLSLNYSG